MSSSEPLRSMGWHRRRVTARQRILELPETAQTLVGSGEIPVRGIDALLEIQAVSPKLAALVAEIGDAAADGNALGEQLTTRAGWCVRCSHRDPADCSPVWLVARCIRTRSLSGSWARRRQRSNVEAKTLHSQLDR
jgi:hypothetical protein